ncbi:hypothetical protein [Egbenema bharatensis]|uniref:hypothetical protein n=1 Tax=Egbenema bharatensis TaxID=3463334 RepID=UPI003A8B0C55
MNWYSQLSQLILSFYREDQPLRQKVEVLQDCKVSRRWGTLRINCKDPQAVETVLEAIDLIREPIAQLRLAHQIKILLQGNVVTTLPIQTSKPKTQNMPKPPIW